MLLSRAMGTASQDGQALAEGDIEAFDVGRIDNTTTLRASQQALYPLPAVLDNASLNLHNTGGALLDDLGPKGYPGDIEPRNQVRASWSAVSRQGGSLPGAE